MDRVLCLIETIVSEHEVDEQELWMDLDPNISKFKRVVKEYVTPLIDHLHTDRENGQEDAHYHMDSRYIVNKERSIYLRVFPNHLKANERLEYRMLKKQTNKYSFSTSVNLISKSKLKHDCAHKMKCPHRGFDLSGVEPDEDGIITCPLHSLQFDTKNKMKLVNNTNPIKLKHAV